MAHDDGDGLRRKRLAGRLYAPFKASRKPLQVWGSTPTHSALHPWMSRCVYRSGWPRANRAQEIYHLKLVTYGAWRPIAPAESPRSARSIPVLELSSAPLALRVAAEW